MNERVQTMQTPGLPVGATRWPAWGALLRLACLGLLLAVAQPGWAQRTNEELMVILKDVVARDPDVALMGIGSWTGGNKKYKAFTTREQMVQFLFRVQK